MDYVRQRMQQFIEDTEFNNQQAAQPIYKKQRPTIRRAATKEVVAIGDNPNFTPQQMPMMETSSVPEDATAHMTPKERMAYRKQQEALRREEEMRQAAHGAKQNYADAKVYRQVNNFENIMSVANPAHVANFDPRA